MIFCELNFVNENIIGHVLLVVSEKLFNFATLKNSLSVLGHKQTWTDKI